MNSEGFYSYKEPSHLYWNTAKLMQEQGLKNVPALAKRMEVHRATLYDVQNAKMKKVSLLTLTRLCLALDATPGDWFTWRIGPEGQQQLVWAVKEQAEARGLVRAKLIYRSEVHPGSIIPIWQGKAKEVALDTLSRIAQALNTSQPFSIGSLFTWASPDYFV